MMKLFKLTCDDVDYEMYDGAIIAATSVRAARKIWDEFLSFTPYQSAKDFTVEEIGVYNKLAAGIVMTSNTGA
jgi:hypothetical protein